MTFEDLDTWKQARSLVSGIYALTREALLRRDLGLSSRLRAALSVMTNVAEGFERAQPPEKLQFYNVARGADAVGVGKLVTGLIAPTEKRRGPIARTTFSLPGALLAAAAICHLSSPISYL
jgi:hypothetical protein